MKINFKEVNAPQLYNVTDVSPLTEATIKVRQERLIENMKANNLSSVIVYADKEHGGNFEYLTGFIPRFEEGLQIFNVDGSSTLILGNENFNKVKYSRTKSEGIKCTLFSLPNQPINHIDEMTDVLKQANIDTSAQVGIVGWKLLPGMTHDYDVPAFIITALKNVVDNDKLINATHVYIDPKNGARIVNNANEIAHYEYGASLASDSVLNALNALEVGVSEQAVGNYLQANGFFPSVVTISAFGDRFTGANIYPTAKELSLGDKVALTVAYRGGLSSRSGYAVNNKAELDDVAKNYYEEVMIPYFEAYNFWLENVKVGTNGGEFFKAFDEFYPQSKFGWELNPGHLTANEEWLSSPFYDQSEALVQSGMIFAVDFIPIQAGFNGVSAESTVAVADATLRQEIQVEYPELWERIESRRKYMLDELGINLSEELLPLAGTLGYYRPFMLDKSVALIKE